MPDTATAPTMTPAQTRAAGTRMIGFYEGVGGVKVDALIDPANFLTKAAAGGYSGNVDGNGYAQALYLERQSTGAPWIATSIGLDPSTQLTYFHSAGSANGGFVWQNPGELMRLTSGGRLGVGTPSPIGLIHANTPSTSEALVWAGNTNNGAGVGMIGGTKPGIGCHSNNTVYICGSVAATPVDIGVFGTTVWRPGGDNATDLGGPGNRFAVVRAGTGAINTCDIRFKLFRIGRDTTAAEHAAALECFEVFGFFQFLDAIAAKGVDGARSHFGPGAQEVWSIWAAHGLVEPLVENDKGELVPVEGRVPPAFLCFDKIDEERPPVMEGWRPSSLLGPDGEPIMVKCADGEEATEQRPTGETIVTREAGHIFGVRIDQLQSLMLIALNKERKTTAAAIAALEARIALLEPA